jgi:CRISPR system Cascade subunit CasE
MYYTHIIFNPVNRYTIGILNDVYKQHEFIMSGFKTYGAQEIGRVLYRMEPPNEGFSAIVQSVVPPTYDPGSHHRGAIASARTKQVMFAGEAEPRFKNDMAYRFRLRANTVFTRQGKRIGLMHEEALREWFEPRTESIGVSLHGYHVIDEGHLRGNRNGKHLTFKVARYEGTLFIRDGRRFSAAFIGGFGHAKGFGCGLISLSRT